VDVDAFDRTVVAALESAGSPDLYELDEIGKMELLSSRFGMLVGCLVKGTVPMLATVPVAPLPVVVRLQRRADVHLVRMDAPARDRAAQEVARWCRDLGFPMAERPA